MPSGLSRGSASNSLKLLTSTSPSSSLSLSFSSSGCKGSYDTSQAKPAAPTSEQRSKSGPTRATRRDVAPATQTAHIRLTAGVPGTISQHVISWGVKLPCRSSSRTCTQTSNDSLVQIPLPDDHRSSCSSPFAVRPWHRKEDPAAAGAPQDSL